jgi:hypothetical protein
MIKALQSMSLGDLYSIVFAYESCLDGLNPSGGNSGESSINAASHYCLATVISVAVVVSEEILVVIAMINTTAEATILAEVMVKGVASTTAEIKVVPINLEVATSNAGAEVAPMTVDALILLDKSVARKVIMRFAAGNYSRKIIKFMSAL